jgi:transcription elongation factor GreA
MFDRRPITLLPLRMPTTLSAVSTTKLSKDAYDRLKAEFDDLVTRGKIDIARRIEAARELGDLSENGDYHAAKEEQGKMDMRMRQLLAIIESAEIVDNIDTSTVSEGSVVEIRYEGDDLTERYLLGSIEERRDGLDVISAQSPLGAALIGHKIGETVEYKAPGGKLKVEVVSISV